MSLNRFFGWFNRSYDRFADGYVGICRALIRKFGVSLVFLAVVTLVAGMFGAKLPTGFLPDEDQGYVYIGIQLPFAASMERTAEITSQAEQLALSTPGVQSCTTAAGYSLLSQSYNSYSAFIWVTLEGLERANQTGGKLRSH